MPPAGEGGTLTSIVEGADAMFEYTFVRIGEGRLSALFGPDGNARNIYEPIVHEYAQDGWRLVQVFAPGVAAFGAAKYYELIFEREIVEAEAMLEAEPEAAVPEPAGV